jgi:hypothetical protein
MGLTANQKDEAQELLTKGLKRCYTCKPSRIKPLSEFGVDRSKPSGRTSACLQCRRKYSKSWYDGNAEYQVAAVLADREGKPRPTGQTVKSMALTVKFEPHEMRQVAGAFVKQYGKVPDESDLKAYLERYARAGVLGQAKYVNEKK